MWPIQTLTLLLCLTDEEQLFAQTTVVDKVVPTVEVAAPVEPFVDRSALVIDLPA